MSKSSRGKRAILSRMRALRSWVCGSMRAPYTASGINLDDAAQDREASPKRGARHHAPLRRGAAQRARRDGDGVAARDAVRTARATLHAMYDARRACSGATIAGPLGERGRRARDADRPDGAARALAGYLRGGDRSVRVCVDAPVVAPRAGPEPRARAPSPSASWGGRPAASPSFLRSTPGRSRAASGPFPRVRRRRRRRGARGWPRRALDVGSGCGFRSRYPSPSRSEGRASRATARRRCWPSRPSRPAPSQ